MKKIDELGLKVIILSSQDSFEGVYDVIERRVLSWMHKTVQGKWLKI